MAITFFGASANPADSGTLDDTVARANAPPASTVTGDLIYFLAVVRSGSETLALSQQGGQSWTSQTLYQSGSISIRLFWCRFNGTWTADPSVTDGSHLGRTFSLFMGVWRPTTGTNTWAVDVVEASAPFSAPVSPFDVTVPGRTAIAASTVTIAALVSGDDNTYAVQTGGWSNAGTAQYRNLYGNQMSVSVAYKIQTSAGATGDVTLRQTANGGDQGRYHIITFKEQSSGVSIANVGDELLYHGETDCTIDYAGGSASGNVVTICSADAIADGSAVTQTVTTQGATQLKFTANLSSFTPFAQLYLFVTNGSAQSNSNGYPIKRESRMFVRETVGNLADDPQASLSDIRYILAAPTILDDLDSGTTESTDGSGNIEIGPHTLTEGGDLAPGDPIWVILSIDGVSEAASPAHIAKITPDYE